MSSTEDSVPSLTPHGTVLARHIAGVVDWVISGIIALVAVKQIDGDYVWLQAIVVVSVYLAFYFIFEALFSRTPGKWLTGLKVVTFDGHRCNLKQTVIRTLFRILEVNPLLLGALPAAIRIIWSRRKQRFGDLFAGTMVVFHRR